MEEDYQNTNDNEAKKPDHVFTAEISIEVVGTDKGEMSKKRKAKERKRWRKVYIVSLIAVVVSFFTLSYVALFVSIMIAGMAYGQYDSLKPDEGYGYTPWWYYGL